MATTKFEALEYATKCWKGKNTMCVATPKAFKYLTPTLNTGLSNKALNAFKTPKKQPK